MNTNKYCHHFRLHFIRRYAFMFPIYLSDFPLFFSTASAVGLGAFGAHGLKTRLAENPRIDYYLDIWKTASHYHLIHSLAIILIPFITRNQGARNRIASLFGTGITLFSGSLYTLTLTEYSKLGAVTPFGGVSLILGWIALAFL